MSRALSTLNGVNGYLTQLPILLSELQILITASSNKRIIIETIQCFAYLFDLNPLLVTELKKPTMQVLFKIGLNSESSTLLNNVIQIVYFIKDNKPTLLIDNYWFYCFVKLITNITQESQRKKILGICYTIAKELKTYEEFIKYLLPGLMFIELNIKKKDQPIKELIQFIEIVEIIARNSKKYNSIEEKETFAKAFIESSNIIASLFQILSDIVYNNNVSDKTLQNKANIKDIILIILNIFAIFSRETYQSADYIIHLEILTLLHEIMLKDSELVFSHKTGFKLLVNLFPDITKGENKKKLLSDAYIQQYNYFSNSILNIIQSTPYVQNSPPSVLSKIIRLLDCYYLNKKVPNLKLCYSFSAQLVSLILSNQSYKYYCNCIDFLEHILNYSLNEFKTLLLREGVINQLKNIDYPSIDNITSTQPQFTITSFFVNTIKPKPAKAAITSEMIKEIKVKVERFFKLYGSVFDEDQESKNRLEELIYTRNQLILLKDNDKIIIDAIDLLINKQNPITQYEINQSQIIEGICDYLDTTINEVIKAENYRSKPIVFPCEMNDKIYHKTSIIIEHLLSNETNLQLFIQRLNNQLSKITSFDLIEPAPSQDNRIGKFRLIYNRNIFDNIQSEMENLGDFANELTQFHIKYSSIQQYLFDFEEKEKVKLLFDMLYIHSHVIITKGDDENCFIPKIVLYYDNDITEEIVISKDETFKELLLKMVLKQKINQGKSDVWDSEIIIRFGLLYDIKDGNNATINYYNLPQQAHLFCSHSVYFSYLTGENKDITSIKRSQFESAYYNHIIFNKGIYINKEACPALYLLSVVYNALKCFNEKTKEIDNGLFQNNAITSLIILQLFKGEVVIMNKIPKWMKMICSSLNHISSFKSRFLLFKLVFHFSRTYFNFESMIKTKLIQSLNQFNNRLFPMTKQRYIYKAQRGNEVKSVQDIMTFKDIETNYAYIEFEFINEIGNGQGPTLEFYSNLFNYWQNQTDLWIKTSNGFLYPKPVSGNEETFKQIGFAIARAIMDNRLFDFPLSSIFYDLVLERPILIETINEMDSHIGKVIRELMRISIIKNSNHNTSEGITQLLKYEGKISIEDLGLSFVLPGYDNIFLKPQGLETHLTLSNIEEYIQLIYQTLFFNNSILSIKQSFIDGFNIVFNYTNLSLFTSKELEEKICGSLEEKWDKSTLEMNIIPDHGYTKSSPVFLNLMTYLASLSKENQKKFIQFTTGTSRLPLGGFANLNPKLTVVKRHTEHYDNPDFFLPSVMTCQNYLKLPEYSSYEILQSKISLAINEGADEFHLS